ncbi:hypothetical protein DPMN_003856 [Dreissena polymorpha]|uniref:Uncharacterized protein n=1 Tax=Dreissena polymorpha TaxID=45954 RepID=A0A9D4RV42_DREPO|nr:hypothetical protein DPMN_003856 [Dreissena polymorpha]
MALRRHIELGTCVTHRAHKSAKFCRCGTPTPRDNRDFRLLLWGNGPIRAKFSVTSATLSPKRWH